jgi:hypothetical protein
MMFLVEMRVFLLLVQTRVPVVMVILEEVEVEVG